MLNPSEKRHFHHLVGSRAVELRVLAQWWQMGYQIEAKENSGFNAMPEFLVSDTNDM